MEAAIQHLNARFNFNVDNLIADSSTYLILGAFWDPRFMDLIFGENVTDRAYLIEAKIVFPPAQPPSRLSSYENAFN